MTTSRRRTPAKTASRPAATKVAKKTATRAAPQPNSFEIPKVSIEILPISSVRGYEYNPRDNDAAVDQVANSIRQFGFLVPCVIDDKGVLITGHTRVKAAIKIGVAEIPIIRASHLTPAQAKAFRLADNKLSELATWNTELLMAEMQQLSAVGYDISNLGWTEAEIDCLSALVSDDCLSTDDLVTQDEGERIAAAPRRAPQTTRIVIGDIVCFVPAANYRRWVDGVRTMCEFDEEQVALEVTRRLGISTE